MRDPFKFSVLLLIFFKFYFIPLTVVYVETEKTTTDKKDITFSNENKIVYSIYGTYLFEYPIITGTIQNHVYIQENTKLISTGIDQNNNWVRIEYENKIYYCPISCISYAENK